MAVSGSNTKGFCNDMCNISYEWSAVPDGDNPNLIFTFNIYLDTSGAKRISKIPASSQNYVRFCGKDYYFTSPEVTEVGKVLIGTVVSNPVSLDEIGYVRVCFYTDSFRAYTGTISYIKNAETVTLQFSDISETIVKASSISFVGERTLGIDHYINVAKGNEEFTHTIIYKCGTKGDFVCDKSSVTTIPVNFPLALATENTTGTTLKVTFDVTTYYGNVPIATESGWAYYTIPETVKPLCTIKVTEGEYRNGQPLKDIYGGYVQKQSRLHIVVTPTLAYGSAISSYSINANGVEYNQAEITTGVLKYAGSQEVTVTVTDERGRTSETVVETVEAIPYTVPLVTEIKVNRCDENGVEQVSGNDHIKVTFDAKISAINDINSASYMLTYQKVSGLEQTDINLTEYSGLYSVVDGSYIFEADPNSPYEVKISATDDFATGSRTTGGSSATTIFNILASGLGMCFGAVATLDNVIENAFLTYPSGGFMFPTIEAGDSLYTPKKPNVYRCASGQDVDGSPTDNPFILISLHFNDDELTYIVIDCDCNIYIRVLIDSSWSPWRTFSTTEIE